MPAVVILIVLFYVFSIATKANTAKNKKSGTTQGNAAPANPDVVARIEAERRRAEEQRRRESYEAKYGKGSWREPIQTGMNAKGGEGSARPGSMDPFAGTRQGVSMGTAQAINRKQRPIKRTPATGGSMGTMPGVAEGNCAPDHEHDSILKPRTADTVAYTGPAVGNARAASGARKLPRFSENEAVNGLVWAEIIKRPRRT